MYLIDISIYISLMLKNLDMIYIIISFGLRIIFVIQLFSKEIIKGVMFLSLI